MIDNYIAWSTRFIPFYNEIARTINSMTHNQIGYKNSCYQTVTQNDLNTLRDAIRELYSYALDIGKFRAHLHDPNAITDTENYLKIHDGKGFVVYPADQSPSHKDVFESDGAGSSSSSRLSFADIPVQKYQFRDMADMLNAITHLILGNAPQSAFQVVSTWSNCITKSMVLSGEMITGSVDYFSDSKYVSANTEHMGKEPDRYNYQAQQGTIRYQLGEYDKAPLYVGSRHLFCCHKEYRNIDTMGEAGNPTIVYNWQEHDNDVTYSGTADGVDTSTAWGQWSQHYCQVTRIVPILCPTQKAKIDDLFELDNKLDGLIDVGCSHKVFNAVEVVSSHEVRYNLGTTNGGRYGCNLYHTLLIDKYLYMHSFSIRKVAHSSITSQTFTSDGTTYRIGYSTLKRPNGVEMPIYWQYNGNVATFGKPVNHFDYYAQRLENGKVQVLFANKACHEFSSSGSFSQAYIDSAINIACI